MPQINKVLSLSASLNSSEVKLIKNTLTDCHTYTNAEFTDKPNI